MFMCETGNLRVKWVNVFYAEVLSKRLNFRIPVCEEVELDSLHHLIEP